MPTYEYRCQACEQVTEAVQSFTDEPLTVCPLCGGALRKLFSGVGVVFKGSGFYRTDSRGSSGSAAGKDSSSSTTSSSSSTSTAATESSSKGTGGTSSSSSSSPSSPGSSTAG